MTILDALAAKVKYPLGIRNLELILLKRDLDSDDEATSAVVKSRSFELARADAMVELIDAVNISEGGYSISLQDENKILSLANAIYRKWGEEAVTTEPVITYLGDQY
jgi:hypothetical protein